MLNKAKMIEKAKADAEKEAVAAVVKAEQKTLASNFTEALRGKEAPSPGDIASACGVSEQAVSNWKRTGKITKTNLAIVARLTGWSIEKLMGRPEGPSLSSTALLDSESPTALTAEELDLIVDFRSLPEEERSALASDLAKRGAKARAFEAEILSRHKGKATALIIDEPELRLHRGAIGAPTRAVKGRAA